MNVIGVETATRAKCEKCGQVVVKSVATAPRGRFHWQHFPCGCRDAGTVRS